VILNNENKSIAVVRYSVIIQKHIRIENMKKYFMCMRELIKQLQTKFANLISL